VLDSRAMVAERPVVVVIPARDEAPRIGAVIATVPTFVDHIVLVDDGSDDGTSAAAAGVGDRRLRIVRHRRPRGVGAAIARGFDEARALGAAATAVMAGDGQMRPEDLAPLVRAVIDGGLDWAQGDRIGDPREAARVPRLRRYGIFALASLTRAATGLPVRDAQCGYVCAGPRALALLGATGFWRGYGYPNDVLLRLARAGLRVGFVPVAAVYRGEPSRLRLDQVGRVAARLATAAVARLARRALFE
jgi:glycosyltransferase involved in cell wall biosynthesis